jgi:hypothetical protein
MMIFIDNKEYDVSQLAKTSRLNGIDNCLITIPESLPELSYALQTRKKIQVFDESYLIFEGFAEDPDIDINIIQFNAKGKLAWLQKNNLPYDILFQDYDLIKFLNKNNYGIVFKDYNLNEYQKFFSIKFSLQNQFEALSQLSEVYGFNFWYDYTQDVCLVGKPDKVINITDDDIFDGKAIISLPISINTSNQANYLQVFGGGIDKLNINAASPELVTNLGYTISEQTNPFEESTGRQTFVIKDDQSIEKYGILGDSIVASSIDQQNLTNENKLKTANLLLLLGSTELKSRKDPLIKLDNFIYYLEENSKLINFNNGNIFRINAHIDSNNPDSEIIKEDFIISDISYVFTHNSTEGAYTCTLLNNLPVMNKTNKLLNNISRSISRSTNSLANRVLNFSTQIEKENQQKITFSLDSSFKSIQKYEMYITVSHFNGNFEDYSKISILFDKINITSLFSGNNLEVRGAKSVRFPELLNADLLKNSILQENQISKIINNEENNKHELLIINEGNTVTSNIQITIIIEAEI